MAKIINPRKFETFGEAFADWRKFQCDGTCNNDSDVCCHRWEWICAECVCYVQETGEEMELCNDLDGLCSDCL